MTDPATETRTRRDDLGGPVIGSDEADSIILGRKIEAGHGVTHRIRYPGDQGVVVVGPNGKGKGTRLLMPNLLQLENRSMVVIDPKGELAAVTAPFRRTLGRVVILNPFGVLTDLPGYEDLRSEGFNPLGQLDPDAASFNRKASQLAEALIPLEERDKFFAPSARNLVAALIMWATIEARAKGEAPTIARVRELLCQPSDEPHRGNDFQAVGLPKLALEMAKSTNSALRNKAAQFSTWNKTTDSVVKTAMTHTECFDDTEVADDVAKGFFDFADLKREPITVYLILPPDAMDRHAKWLRIVITAAIQALMRTRQLGEPRALFMMDEFYALGHLEIIASVWALVRGYGIQMMPVLQSLGQLKELYPKSWQTLLGMAGVVATFATNEPETADWFSKRGGDTERMTVNRSTTTNDDWGGLHNGSSRGFSYASTRSALISPHKLYGLRPGYMIGAFDGLSHLVPIYAPPYFDITQCKDRARNNPYYLGKA